MTTWHEPKRQANLALHGLDFAGCERIWDGFTITREDRRAHYGEVRLVCFGVIDTSHVVLVYTERPTGPHIISLRKAVKHEIAYYRKIAHQADARDPRSRQSPLD